MRRRLSFLSVFVWCATVAIASAQTPSSPYPSCSTGRIILASFRASSAITITRRVPAAARTAPASSWRRWSSESSLIESVASSRNPSR